MTQPSAQALTEKQTPEQATPEKSLDLFQDQLSAEEQAYSQVFEFATEAYLVTDWAGVIQDANSAAVSLLNMPRPRLTGVSLAEFFSADDRRYVLFDLATLSAHPIVRRYDLTMRTADQTTFPATLRVTRLVGTGVTQPRFLWSVHDQSDDHAATETRAALHQDKLLALHDIALDMGTKPNLRAQMQQLAIRLLEQLQVGSLVIYTHRPERGELELEIAKGLPASPGTLIPLGEGPFGQVAQERQPQMVEAYPIGGKRAPAAEAQTISGVIVPMLCFDELVGVLGALDVGKTARQFTRDDVRLAALFATFAAFAVNSARVSSELAEERARRISAEQKLKSALKKNRTLSEKLEGVREEERKHLARNLHDDLGQFLTGVKLELTSLAKNQKALLEKSQALMALSDSTIESVQRLSSELRPGLLDESGLAGAIEWQAQDFGKRTGIECAIHCSADDTALDKHQATAVFRIFQETLTNIARHAHATELAVELKEEGGRLVLQVKDNGAGISEDQINSPKSLGIIGMRERAELLGGKIEIRSAPNQGATVTLRVPIKRPRDAEERQ